MIRWFLHNPVAANLLMATLFFGGLFTLLSGRIPLEFLPEFQQDQVNITTTLRGATPSSVEQGVSVRIEEAIFDLEGIEKISTRSQEGISIIQVDIEKGVNNQELLNKIKLRVDAITTFPADAEKPVIDIPVRSREAISVVIHGNLIETELRKIAEFHRDKMIALPEISKIDFDSAREFEISITVDQEKLTALDLTLENLSQRINQNSLDLSAGSIKSRQGEVLIRTDAQAYFSNDFARIPVLTRNDGSIIFLKDIATINDGFEEDKVISTYNGQSAIVLDVFRTGDQNIIEIAETIKQYIEDNKDLLPSGTNMSYWRDRSKVVKGRLSTLVTSAWQGGLLVVLLLTLFLRPAVSFWVSLSIPISFMGTILLMPILGLSFNVVTMFAFILALGIVVDDAIVTGENVYRHMGMGKDSTTAALEGTYEVATPVTFGVITTVVAFTPLLFIEGVRGAIFAQIPAIVIPILLLSLVESKFVLPSHLRHVKPLKKEEQNSFGRAQRFISQLFEKVALKIYQPILSFAIRNKLLTLLSTIIISSLVFTYASSGWMKFAFWPKIESEVVSISLTMPSQTAFEVTDNHIRFISDQVHALQEKYRDQKTDISWIKNILSTSGGRGLSTESNIGRVSFEVLPPEERKIDFSTRTLVSELRRMIGTIPGAEQLSFRLSFGRAGEPIDVQLQSNNFADLKTVGTEIKSLLSSYDGLFDTQDTLSDGKDEFQITLKPSAYNLAITLREIGEQTRHAIFGLETQRIQRGRNEIRVMLKTPIQNRSSLTDLYSLPIRLSNGEQVALSEIATIDSEKSPSSLYRIDRFSTINITSDAEQSADLEAIKRNIVTQIEQIVARYPDMSFEMEGEAKEQKETFGSVGVAITVILLIIYCLLAIPFKSYGQPLIVMSIIPVGAVGAVLGHILEQKGLSVMSIMGILALTGVVINDSLVLVDYINKERARGTELIKAVMRAGVTRFRPVILTSLTTFVGLTPLLLEKSTQAKFIQPMAVSLGYGILFATIITLLIVPVNYLVFENIKSLMKKIFLKRVPAQSSTTTL